MRVLSRLGLFLALLPLLGQLQPIPQAEFEGTLRSVDKKGIVLMTHEENLLTFRRSKRTKFLRDGKDIDSRIAPIGSEVTILGSKDRVGDLEAYEVRSRSEHAEEGKD